MLIDVKDLSIDIEGKTIVDRIDFSVRKGEIVAIIGPNGAGKSTLMRAILGMLPYRGEIIKARGLRFGMVPQAPQVNRVFPLTVFELFRLLLNDDLLFPHHRFAIRIRNALKKVNGENLAEMNLRNLSMGELQKVLIAAALLQNPDILFLDEPTSSLDVVAQRMVLNEMVRLAKEEGKGVVFISHDIGVVYHFADKVVCLNREQKCFGVPKRVLTPHTLLETYGPEYAFYFHPHHKHEARNNVY